MRKNCLVIALALAVVAVVGCGGSGDTSTAGSTTVSDPLAKYPKGPTREFIIPDGDNAVQTFGREGTRAEREEASRLIHNWMQARADRNYEKDCSYLSKTYKRELVRDAHSVSNGRVKICARALDYFGPQASGDFKNTLDGPIDSLRLAAGHGYAQYHGNDGRDWIVPVNREDGKLRVSIASPLDRTK
jgi:hypothetical protein